MFSPDFQHMSDQELAGHIRDLRRCPPNAHLAIRIMLAMEEYDLRVNRS